MSQATRHAPRRGRTALSWSRPWLPRPSAVAGSINGRGRERELTGSRVPRSRTTSPPPLPLILLLLCGRVTDSPAGPRGLTRYRRPLAGRSLRQFLAACTWRKTAQGILRPARRNWRSLSSPSLHQHQQLRRRDTCLYWQSFR